MNQPAKTLEISSHSEKHSPFLQGIAEEHGFSVVSQTAGSDCVIQVTDDGSRPEVLAFGNQRHILVRRTPECLTEVVHLLESAAALGPEAGIHCYVPRRTKVFHQMISRDTNSRTYLSELETEIGAKLVHREASRHLMDGLRDLIQENGHPSERLTLSWASVPAWTVVSLTTSLTHDALTSIWKELQGTTQRKWLRAFNAVPFPKRLCFHAPADGPSEVVFIVYPQTVEHAMDLRPSASMHTSLVE